MIQLGIFSLFIGVTVGHYGLKSITVDGITYPPYDSRIDNLLGNAVRRIEWYHDVAPVPWRPNFNVSSPALACNENPRAPLLKAPVRAGGIVQFNWTEIVTMHFGPALAYLGEFPSIDTKPQDIQFFKIFEQGYDNAKGKWANEIASDNHDSYNVQIPSDIKSGTYVLRTEMIALHGNANQTIAKPGPQFYTYCFNVEVLNGGTAKPEGVKFPGAYKPEDFQMHIYLPQLGDSAATIAKGNESNSKYVLPGPPLYKGKYNAPTGSPPVVHETGAYTGELEVKYEAMANKFAVATQKMIDYVNKVFWKDGRMTGTGSLGFPAVVDDMLAERRQIMNTTEFLELKKAIEKS